MNWIRFDKQQPPEDTTVMVSNGPAMGHYHYMKRIHDKAVVANDDFFIPLWTMDGVRVECKVKDAIQWAHLLPVRGREIKPKVSAWKRFMKWIGLSCVLFIPLWPAQHSQPSTPITKFKKIEKSRSQSMDDSVQEMLNLEIIKKQIEEKFAHQQPSHRRTITMVKK